MKDIKKMDSVVHFEMPYEDKKRMADFYTKSFGWEVEMLGEEMENYVLVATDERDEKGMPKNPGSIGGGFYKKPKDKSNECPSVVIAVEDIEISMKKIKAAGGKIINEKPIDIPEYGLYVGFTDTEGNRVSIIQPYQRM